MILYCDAPGCGYSVDEADTAGSSRPAAWRLNSHRKNKHGLEPTTEAPAMPDPATPPSDAEGTSPIYGDPGPTAPATGEIPPAPGAGTQSAGVAPPRRRGLFGRRKAGASSPAPAGRPTRERAPKPAKAKPSRGARLSAAATITDVWGFLGNQTMRTGHVPTGRMLTWQAPIAGELLDDVAKGTIVDKLLLQRVVGARGKFDAVAAVAGPPLLTLMLERAMAAGDEAKAAMLAGMLKAAIKNALPTMVPAMKKARRKEADAQTAMAELLDPADLDAFGVDVVDGRPVDRATGQVVDVGDLFVGMLFSEWTAPAPAAAPEPEEVPTP